MKLASCFLVFCLAGFSQSVQTVNNESFPTARTKINSNFSALATKACVGTPGNTTSVYMQDCQDTSGHIYACNNAAGCTVASDWVLSGGGSFTALSGDATSTSSGGATSVVRINGQSLSGLATGILKNTIATGVPSIAVAGDFPTLNQSTSGTAAGLSSTLVAGSGGTGVANTATLTLGSSNQNWATLGTGIVKNTITTGALTNGAYGDIVALWTTCSAGYLKFDGTCSTPGGTFTTLSGDATSTSTGGSTTVVGINGTLLSGLATGILKNTIATGVPSIAVAGDFPTLNQSTSGTAAKATNLVGGTVGKIPYQSAADTTLFVTANTAATDQVLISHGTGAAGQAPTLGNAPALSAANMTSFPTLNQSTSGTAAGLSTTLVAGSGGTGVANTATLTLGSSNQNWATLGTGIVKNTVTTGALTDAAASDVIAIFGGGTCSGYLKSDGTCATPGGSGTVTVVSSGALASTALVTGGGTTTLQTPSATTTVDSGGNISTQGGISTGVGGTTAGSIALAYYGTTEPSITMTGHTSGTVTVNPQAAAGTPTILWPNTSGTVATTGTSPIAVSATTGAVSCATCAVASSPGVGIAHFAGSTQTVTSSAVDLSGADVTGTLAAARMAAQYKTWACETGLGDGLNAVPAGTYLQRFCYNTTGVTVTLTGLKCFSDNAGSSTMNAAGVTLGALLTGAITCSSTIAAGTQSASVALTNGDAINFTFVSDGASKQTTWVVTGTY